MDFNFELYEGGEAGRTRDRVHVTLGKDSHIYFSGKAVEALGRPEGVALMYDRRRQAIGVMPSAPDRKHAYRLRQKAGMGAGRVITAKNFCRYFEIKPSETLAFRNASVNRDGILVLDLHSVEKAGR